METRIQASWKVNPCEPEQMQANVFDMQGQGTRLDVQVLHEQKSTKQR
jgi:hypothetical protein